MSQAFTDHDLLRHPFFEAVPGQPNFTDCINAIDRARSVMALCDALKLDEEEGGLPPDAALGFYWLTVLARNALAYVSTRLVELEHEHQATHQQSSACLTALLESLQTLGGEHRERLLNQAAKQMKLTRREIDRLIEALTET